MGGITSTPKKEELKKTRIILVDVSLILRQAIRTYLEKQQDMEIVGEAGDGKEAVYISTKLRPDIVIIDVDLPLFDGLEATKQIVEKSPDTKVLVMTAHGDENTILLTQKAGASGYLMKREPVEVLALVIRRIVAGDKIFRQVISDSFTIDSSQKTNWGRNKSLDLTTTELKILRFAASGMSNKDIASNLHYSLPYIKASLSNIYTKLGVSSRIEAILLGLKSDILNVNDLR